MKQALLIPVVCFFVAGSIGLAAQRRSNVAGTWQLSVDVGDTHGTPTVVLQQKGSALTGTITNARGQQKLAGTVEGKDAMFAFETVREGQPFAGVYRGTVESSRKMTGTVEFTGALSGAGTWVATKK